MVVKRRIVRQETMDKPNVDLSILMRHFEVHNRTEGKAGRTFALEYPRGSPAL